MDSSSLMATEAVGAEGASAPRVTLDGMKDKIAFCAYFTAGDAINHIGDWSPGQLHVEKHAGTGLPPELDLLTICIVTMQNGFTVIGKSAPASAANFDADKGRLFAYEDAIRQIWPLEGYALREKLAA